MTAVNRKDFLPEQIENDRRVLELLARSFPNIGAASSEIINLEAILTFLRVRNTL